MKRLEPETFAAPFGAYSQGHWGNFSRLAATSGQLGIRADRMVPPSVTEQAEICFSAIPEILSEAGLGPENALRINAYVTQRKHMAEYMKVRDRTFAQVEPKPCLTLPVVSGFTWPEILVEVEAIAGAP